MSNKPDNIVEAEQQAYLDTATPLEVNGNTNAEGKSDDEKVKLEKTLSRDNITARVITWTGDYLKIKFFRDNKVLTTYKSKSDGSVAGAKQWLDDTLTRNDVTS